jgi:hypothetical protein
MSVTNTNQRGPRFFMSVILQLTASPRLGAGGGTLTQLMHRQATGAAFLITKDANWFCAAVSTTD